jgi:hypothetical protein
MDIELDIDDEIYEQLVQVADEDGIAVEVLIEQILSDYCDSVLFNNNEDDDDECDDEE